MRKLWTTDRVTIEEELRLVVKEKIPFNLFQHGQPVRNLIPHDITIKDKVRHIVFAKLTPFNVSDDICYLLYHRPGELMRGFNGPSKRESEQLLAVPLPVEIFQVQRRKFPRVSTPGNSIASIALDYTKLPNMATVADISMEGASLNGNLSPRIHKDEIIGPITFTLRLGISSVSVDTFTVPKATVAWVRDKENNTREIGLHFKLSGASKLTLEHYIKLRSAENESK